MVFPSEKPPNTRFKDLQTSKRGRIPQKDRQTTHYKICQNINYWALKCSDKNVNEVSCMVHEFVLHNSSETTLKKTSLQNLELFCFFLIVLIGIHFMQSWTATTRHGVTRKRSTKKLKHTQNLFRKSLHTGVYNLRCLLILDLKPFRSQVKRKYYIGREFQSLAVWGKKLFT